MLMVMVVSVFFYGCGFLMMDEALFFLLEFFEGLMFTIRSWVSCYWSFFTCLFYLFIHDADLQSSKIYDEKGHHLV
ncbi:hypothetical protein BZA77DRAFT_321265 [Pyronema omphalodes]|nr:hypothetical protein BZA77DRAFT_321265 [Pyronema omphalodes]